MPIYKCFLCEDEFQFGPHSYLGKPINAWGIMVCNECLAANRDGIVRETYPHLAAHLDALGLQPEKNAEGWILWPSN
jgi:hypothetical protein